MAYSKQTWIDGPGGGTPITAARLNHIEDGIDAADVPAPVTSVNTRTGAITGLAEQADLLSPLVMKFQTSGYSHVFHGKLWPNGVNLGTCWWDAWIKVASASQYWISEGYGGGHAILVGWGGTRSPTANMFDGVATSLFITGDYTAADGEWLHDCFTWNGTNAYRYINGIPVAKVAYASTRQAQQGTLFIGGSHHQSFLGGSIAMVRGFEGVDASDRTSIPMSASYDGAAFRPNSTPIEYKVFPEAITRPVFMAVYDTRSPVIVDLGAGFAEAVAGPKLLHPGILAGNPAEGGVADMNVINSISNRDWTPYFTTDTGSPLNPGSLIVPTQTAQVPVATPSGAVVWDSFSRENQTYAFRNSPTLGSTEGGSAGVLPWSQGAPVFGAAVAGSWGILKGQACYLLGNAPGFAFVDAGIANQDIRVTRNLVGSGLHNTGILFRGTDFANCWVGYTTGSSPTTCTLNIQSYTGGTASANVPWACPATNWSQLRIVALGTDITGYVDNLAGGWTQIGTLSSSTQQTATQAGLAYSNVDLGCRRALDIQVRAS